MKYLPGSGKYQGFIKGKNIDEVWITLSKKGSITSNGAVKLPDGTILWKYSPSTTGVPSVLINRPNQIKIAIRFSN